MLTFNNKRGKSINMKLPKQKLAKGPSTHRPQAKHKKSTLKDERRLAKVKKSDEMSVVSEQRVIIEETELTVQEKLLAKSVRKAANKHKLAYKKLNVGSISHFNGPRAITK